jgi:hypothetical protein
MTMAMAEPTTDKPPRFDLRGVFRLRDKLIREAFFEYHGFSATGEHFDNLVDDVTSRMPGAIRSAVYDSLALLAGKHLTDDVIREICWRLAANTGKLRAGIAVKPWDGQSPSGWCAAEIASYTATEKRYGRAGGQVAFQILAGLLAPRQMSLWWSRAFCSMLARRIGFSRPWGDYPYRDPHQLVRMRLLIVLDCAKRFGGVEQVACSSAAVKWNRSIMRLRLGRRPDGGIFECPHGITVGCLACNMGVEDCPLAVLPGHGNEPESDNNQIPV